MALVLGSLSFVGFVSLAIPDRIGDGKVSTGNSSSLSSHLSRTQTATGVQQAASSAGDETSDEQLGSTSAVARAGVNTAARLAGTAVKRGFTPPLDRPAQATPAPVPVTEPSPVPPPPVAEAAAPSPAMAENH